MNKVFDANSAVSPLGRNARAGIAMRVDSVTTASNRHQITDSSLIPCCLLNRPIERDDTINQTTAHLREERHRSSLVQKAATS